MQAADAAAGVIFCDESEAGFGWVSIEPPWMERSSHALLAGGGVWLVDPVDFVGLDERISAFGTPRGVLKLLDRHNRDAAALSERLGVPLLDCPLAVPATPFELFRIEASPRWAEVGLWWPERRTLLVAEAVGTARYYCAPGRPLGVHPLLRLWRRPRALLGYRPEHILCGHGAGLHHDAAEALGDALSHAGRELPSLLPRLLSARRPRGA